MPGMIKYKRDKVRSYYLAHPEATIADVVRDTKISERTVAGVRADMAAEGLVPKARNNQQPDRPAPPPPAEWLSEEEPENPRVRPRRTSEKTGQAPEPDSPKPPREPRRTKPLAVPPGIIDDAAMAKVAAEASLLDIDFDNLDDETIRKKLLKGVISLAFRPGVHPDTQLAATQVWVKLKDMARAKELGPGKPKTKADAIARLTELLRACGPEIAVEAMTIAFNVKGDDDGPTTEQAAPVGGTAEAPVAPRHVDPPAQDEELRTERMGPSGPGGEPSAP